MIDQLKNFYTKTELNHPKKMKIMRYIVSGGIATVTNVAFLVVFTEFFGFWYVISAVVSYFISFAVSFTMQKYWTFRDGLSDRIGSQVLSYVVVTTLNLGLNTLGIFLLVHYGHVYYLLAQIIVSLLIAIESFFVYRLLFRVRM